MPKKKSRKYWEDRIRASEERKESLSDRLSSETKKLYRKSYKRLTKEIDALYIEILDKGIENITRTELYNLNHWNNLRLAIENEIKGLATNDAKELQSLLWDVAMETYEVDLALFNKEFNEIDRVTAEKIVTENWSGATYSDRIWGNASAFSTRVMEDIEMLTINGYSPEKLKKALMKDFTTHYYEADRLIRTEASHVFNQAAIESYKKGGCVRVEYLAEIDCCDVCRPYSKQVYNIADAPHIPVHPNCRCTYLPVIDF